MTTEYMEEQLKDWNVMVHNKESFTTNCLCKFTWENGNEEDESIFINDAKSLEDLIKIIKFQMLVHKVKSSKEADLIINYK